MTLFLLFSNTVGDAPGGGHHNVSSDSSNRSTAPQQPPAPQWVVWFAHTAWLCLSLCLTAGSLAAAYRNGAACSCRSAILQRTRRKSAARSEFSSGASGGLLAGPASAGPPMYVNRGAATYAFFHVSHLVFCFTQVFGVSLDMAQDAGSGGDMGAWGQALFTGLEVCGFSAYFLVYTIALAHWVTLTNTGLGHSAAHAAPGAGLLNGPGAPPVGNASAGVGAGAGGVGVVGHGTGAAQVNSSSVVQGLGGLVGGGAGQAAGQGGYGSGGGGGGGSGLVNGGRDHQNQLPAQPSCCRRFVDATGGPVWAACFTTNVFQVSVSLSWLFWLCSEPCTTSPCDAFGVYMAFHASCWLFLTAATFAVGFTLQARFSSEPVFRDFDVSRSGRGSGGAGGGSGCFGCFCRFFRTSNLPSGHPSPCFYFWLPAAALAVGTVLSVWHAVDNKTFRSLYEGDSWAGFFLFVTYSVITVFVPSFIFLALFWRAPGLAMRSGPGGRGPGDIMPPGMGRYVKGMARGTPADRHQRGGSIGGVSGGGGGGYTPSTVGGGSGGGYGGGGTPATGGGWGGYGSAAGSTLYDGSMLGGDGESFRGEGGSTAHSDSTQGGGGGGGGGVRGEYITPAAGSNIYYGSASGSGFVGSGLGSGLGGPGAGHSSAAFSAPQSSSYLNSESPGDSMVSPWQSPLRMPQVSVLDPSPHKDDEGENESN